MAWVGGLEGARRAPRAAARSDWTVDGAESGMVERPRPDSGMSGRDWIGVDLPVNRSTTPVPDGPFTNRH